MKAFRTPADFRRWLARNHKTAVELWLRYYKKATGRASITWPESVDEALCFGWIDGVRQKVDEESYRVRFTPRRSTSTWSVVNVRKFEALDRAGHMRAAGRRAFEQRRAAKTGTYSYEQRQGLSKPYERLFRRHAGAWSFFQSQPLWYRRTAGFWVMSAKRDDTRQRRLRTLIDDSEAGRTIKPLTRSTRS